MLLAKPEEVRFGPLMLYLPLRFLEQKKTNIHLLNTAISCAAAGGASASASAAGERLRASDAVATIPSPYAIK